MKQKKSSNFWKRSIIIFTCAAIGIGGCVGFLFHDMNQQMYNSSEWSAFSPEDQRFHVQFPSDPKEDVKEIDVADKKIEYQEYTSEIEDTQYMVSYIDFPGMWKMVGSKKLLNKSFDALIEHDQNVEQLISKEHSFHKGLPSLHYQLKQAGKDVRGRLIIAGNTIYRVTVAYPESIAEKVQIEAFLDSFQWLG